MALINLSTATDRIRAALALYLPELFPTRVRATGSGLASRDGKPLREFEIAGPDGKFLPAEAVIEGSDVLVSNAAVPAPTQVRHAWTQIPEANLINKEGLPASAFRTR